MLEVLDRKAASIVSELNLERLLQMVTDVGVEITGAAFGAFFYNVLTDEGPAYQVYTISGVPRASLEKFPMPRSTQVFALTFNGTGVVCSDDITADLRYGHNAPFKGMPDNHLPVRSYLAGPIISRSGEVLGGLLLGHPSQNVFNSSHEQLVFGIAARAARRQSRLCLASGRRRDYAARFTVPVGGLISQYLPSQLPTCPPFSSARAYWWWRTRPSLRLIS